MTVKEMGKFDVKVTVIPNALEKYMAFTINKNLVFIDIMQFMNSSLDSLFKNSLVIGQIMILSICLKNLVVNC